MRVQVLILAGGVGSRMKVDRPKQFIEVNGVPVIVRTIQNFQNNEQVTGITVVCIKDWTEHLQGLIKQYGLTKVNDIVEGGATGHDSTRNGIFSMRDKLTDDDFVVIHDAARPLIPQSIINKMLDIALEYGNACTAIPIHETIILTDDQISGNSEIDRNRIMRVQTPQAYRYGLIYPLYKKADEDNLHNFIYANTMAIHYGTRLYFSDGFNSNVKITTPQDIAFYKALLQFDEEDLAK